MKKIINLVIALFGKFFWQKNRKHIIYYHDVQTEGNGFDVISIEKFQNHMKYVYDKKYVTYKISEFDKVNVKNNLFITFDDGYRSIYDNVYPIIKKYNIRISVFINPKYIDCDNKYLSTEMIKNMYDSGLVDFAAHTYSHVDCWTTPAEELRKECNSCNEYVLDNLGFNCEDFCFPYGHYSPQSLEQLSHIYKRMYTSDCLIKTNINDATVIGRIAISNEDSKTVFIGKLNGNFDVMRYYYSRKHNLAKVKNEEKY